MYFKSTDGHHGQWAFSLRRLNLQLLKVLGEYGGAVVVDSTRRGKSDAGCVFEDGADLGVLWLIGCCFRRRGGR